MNPLKENIQSRIIAKETTIIQALKKMEELAVKLLFIFDREQLCELFNSMFGFFKNKRKYNLWT